MDGMGLILLITLVGIIGILVWQRHRGQRLQLIPRRVRCPIHGDQADLAVQTDPGAPSCRQYVEVVSCSLLSDVAIALPERTAYLADPPLQVRLDPARSFPVYGAKVACPQPCVFALNATAVSGEYRAVTCTSGTSDAIELARQTVGNPRILRLLWYSGC
jgi:hypothetical protein